MAMRHQKAGFGPPGPISLRADSAAASRGGAPGGPESDNTHPATTSLPAAAHLSVAMDRNDL
jgi:hypothetical protein